jgi:hypothetical protein
MARKTPKAPAKRAVTTAYPLVQTRSPAAKPSPGPEQKVNVRGHTNRSHG